MANLKQFARRVVVWKISLLAKLVLRKYRPQIVAVTGSVGKTTTKDMIAAVLASRYQVRAPVGSMNSDFGVPLTILDEPMDMSVRHWLGVFWRGWKQLLRRVDYPEILVLEMGADKPGDIQYLSKLAPPDVAVITNVRNVHLEYYDSEEAVAEEKSWLVRNLHAGGVAVLNYDDTSARMMRTLAPGGVIYYGMTDESNIWVSDAASTLDGTTGTLNVSETEGAPPNTWLLKTPLLGKHQLYAVTAAVGVGLALDVPVPDALATAADFTPPPGRGRLLAGRHGLSIIDDTYNASPQAVLDALAVLHGLPGPHWAVLGDMAELGPVSEKAHHTVGEYVASWLDHLVVIGELAPEIAQAAAEHGMAKDHIHQAKNVREAAELVDPDQKGGTVLVKASQLLYLERVVERLLADPRDKRLLVQRRKDPWHHQKLAKYA